MSKVTKLMKARNTGKRAALLNSLHYFKYDENVYDNKPLDITVLEVSATVGGEIFIKTGASSSAVNYAVKSVNRQVVEELYGEFREPLYALRRLAIAKLDDESIRIIDRIIDEMFTV